MTVDARQEAEAIFATYSAQDWMDERIVDVLAAAIQVGHRYDAYTADKAEGFYASARGLNIALDVLREALSALREHD